MPVSSWPEQPCLEGEQFSRGAADRQDKAGASAIDRPLSGSPWGTTDGPSPRSLCHFQVNRGSEEDDGVLEKRGGGDRDERHTIGRRRSRDFDFQKDNRGKEDRRRRRKAKRRSPKKKRGMSGACSTRDVAVQGTVRIWERPSARSHRRAVSKRVKMEGKGKRNKKGAV
ncbi:hypothetical protein NDU88_000372 [Pleurodeles waltl]|uniref:Uncharacterized protein n=1 Tax=Pleurodeles waltl TaxID=8319 RepID=A0AAV7S9E7_PLEWA|nr:hypothetical protein NDU88_000372 [Pleurodeles waltl]